MFGHDDDHKSNDDGHSDNGWQHPDLTSASSDASGDDTDSPAQQDGDNNHHSQVASPSPTVRPDASDDRPAAATHQGDNDLIDLKQQALNKLSPLVDKLDHPPAEKFRTLMMMIQASDDQRLVRQAYEVAIEIDDEKERAQALLDIVNEINYFTQNPSNSAD